MPGEAIREFALQTKLKVIKILDMKKQSQEYIRADKYEKLLSGSV